MYNAEKIVNAIQSNNLIISLTLSKHQALFAVNFNQSWVRKHNAAIQFDQTHGLSTFLTVHCFVSLSIKEIAGKGQWSMKPRYDMYMGLDHEKGLSTNQAIYLKHPQPLIYCDWLCICIHHIP